MIDIFSLSVEELSSKIKDAQLTSVEVCEKYIERINKFEKDVKAWVHFDKKILLEKEKMIWYFNHYLQQKEQSKEASPLFMPMAASMPKTLIFTAGCDPLRDESIAYGRALIQAGVHVEQHSFEGMIHAYMLLDSLVKSECEETYRMIGEFIHS